jgi:alpha-L-rhamnosidase
MMREMAAALGKKKEAEKYAGLFGKIREAFVERFVKKDGKVGNGSQTCYVLALQVGLLPEDIREKAVEQLVRDIKSRDWHLSTGFLGTAYLMPVLTMSGRNDVASRLLLQETYPSWGYMISKDATTIWERWNGDTGNPAMNSFNHYAFGAVGEWLYRYLAGIDMALDSTGFEEIVIHPYVIDGIDYVRAEHDSIRGTIISGWRRTPSGGITMEVTIPANTRAIVNVPVGPKEAITEQGKKLNQDEIALRGRTDGCFVLSVGSGTYRFESR